MRLLIIGGTGHFSGRITERAVAQGHEVTLYNRGQRPLPPALTETGAVSYTHLRAHETMTGIAYAVFCL